MAELELLETDDGKLVTAKADADGKQLVIAEVDGPDGEDLAREATLQAVRDRLPAPSATVLPINAEGMPTRIIGTVPVSDVNNTYETSVPAQGAPGLVVRPVGTGILDTAQSQSFVLASGHPAIGVTGRVNLAGSGNEITATEIGDVAALDVAVKELAPDAARDSTLSQASDKLDTTNSFLLGISNQLPPELGPAGGLKVEGADGPLALEADKATATLQAVGNATAAAISSFLSSTFGPYTRTSFGQIRVADRVTTFDNLNEYALDPRAWGTRIANGGAVAFNTTTGMTEVTVTNVSGSSSELRTHTHFIYQPGAITRLILTLAHVDGGQTNQRRRWGFFNDEDGLFFELNGTDLSIVRRTSTSGSPVDNQLVRASWDNQYNSLSLTNGSRYEIDLQWLSFGIVHFWINATLVHTLDFGNALTLPYTRTAQLPLSIEVVNTDASVASGMHYVCSTVYLDGGTDLKHVPKSRALAAPKTGIGTSYTPLIGLRMRTTVNGRTNRKVVIPAKTRFSNASGRATVAAIMNPASTTGGSWTAVDSLSGVEYNEGITSYTGGTEISRLYLPNTADTRELDGSDEFALNGLHLRQDAFGAGVDTILFVGKADVGTTDLDVIARWTELG